MNEEEKLPEETVPASSETTAQTNSGIFTNLPTKKLIIAACAAVGVLALIIILIACVANAKDVYTPLETSIGYVFNKDDKEIVIFENGKLTASKIDGEPNFAERSLDGNTYAILTLDNTLYVYTKSALTKVSSDVNYFKLSAEGTYIVYDNSDGEVIHYNIKKAEKNKITNTIPPSTSNRDKYSISPDGKTVAYVKGEASNDYALYLYSDGESEKVGELLIPLALTNKAGLLYYYNNEKKNIYVQNKDGEDVKLISDANSSSSNNDMYFTSDNKTVLFTANKSTYICDNGTEKIKISSDKLESIGNMNNGWGTNLKSYHSVCLLNVCTTSLNDFRELYFLVQDENSVSSLYYLDRKLETTRIAKKIKGYWAAPESDTVYYLDDSEELFRAKGPNDEKPNSIAEDIKSIANIAISFDATECYYVDDDETLRYVKKDGKSKKIADDVYSSISMTHDDYLMFIVDYSSSTNSGTLYCSHSGKEKTKLDEEVNLFITASSTSYYMISSGGNKGLLDVYIATKKARFSKLADDVTSMDYAH